MAVTSALAALLSCSTADGRVGDECDGGIVIPKPADPPPIISPKRLVGEGSLAGSSGSNLDLPQVDTLEIDTDKR